MDQWINLRVNDAKRRATVEARSWGPGAKQRRREPRFELIPYQMAGMNARAVLARETWAQICAIVHEHYGGKCCECFDDSRLECHEVWAYELGRGPERAGVSVMRLAGLRSLCHLCHRGKHFKCAERQGELPQVKAHLMKLYGVSARHWDELALKALRQLELKLRYDYLDLTYLNGKRFDRFRGQVGHHLSDRTISSVVPLFNSTRFDAGGGAAAAPHIGKALSAHS